MHPEKPCRFPFVHANIRHKNNKMVSACWRSDENLGSLETHSLLEIWNGDKFKQMRQMFLDGKWPEGCGRCKDLWDDPNTRYLSLRARMENKLSQWEDDTKLRWLEIRLSSLCNFWCMHCGGLHSSTWRQKLNQHEMLNDFVENSDDPIETFTEDMLSDLIKVSYDLREIHITGGEPLVDPMFAKILESIPEENAKNITFISTSNLSKLDYSYLKLFKKFKKIIINVSIDGDRQTFNHFRLGGDIEVIEKNIAKLQAIGVEVKGVTVLSILTITRLPNIKQLCKDHNIDFKMIFLQDRPKWLDVRNIPFKDQLDISNKIANDYMHSRSAEIGKWEELIRAMETFKSVNGTDYESVWPELFAR